jgi:aspartate-semialdehyde dehydrogenase
MKRSTDNKIDIGIVGATGMVGEVFLELLSEKNFPVGKLKLFASEKSAGLTRQFKGKDIAVETLSEGCFNGLQLVFFSSGDDISKEWAPRAVAAGAHAVDNSAAFRMDPEKLLIVPEVNGHLLDDLKSPTLIANPNCSTIQLVVTLKPLHSDFGLDSVHVATYQAVSGAGRAGQEELAKQIKDWSPEAITPSAQTFPHRIALNCIPEIGSFQPNGFCSEEVKIMKESKKILGDSSFRISAFTVRVPIWNSHSEAVWVRLKKTPTRLDVLRSLESQQGLIIQDNPQSHIYPLATTTNGQGPVYVGRVHQDPEDAQTWLMWIVSDNLRKGAALNGLQIAERIFEV